MIYPLILIGVLLLAIIYGWHRGMVRQMASLLGVAFGFVAARLFYEQAAELLSPLIPPAEKFAPEPFGTPMRMYASYLVGAVAVFTAVFIVLRLLSGLLVSAMQLIHTGAINAMLGAAFCFCKWVIIMSIAFNLWLVIRPDCGLLKYCTDGDGNVVELVMDVAPALFGTDSPTELDRYRRLQEAQHLEQG